MNSAEKQSAASKGRGLQASGITVRFGGLAALVDVSLEIRKRETLGLIGPNGAGKTTLLNAITGFQALESGRVMLDGVNGTSWSPAKWSRRGVVRTFQGARCFDRLTVRENVEVGAVATGQTRSRARSLARELLEQNGLGAYAGVVAGALPAGLRRRLGVARALACNPAFLLMDEPAAGLNEGERTELVEIIRQISSSSDCGILIVEHSMPVIMSVCSRLHVLDGGKTLMEGTPAEARQDPRVREAYLGD